MKNSSTPDVRGCCNFFAASVFGGCRRFGGASAEGGAQAQRQPPFPPHHAPAMLRATWTPLAEAWDREWVMPEPSPMM